MYSVNEVNEQVANLQSKMDTLAAEEYMDVVTTYRCKFCDFCSEQAKDIGLHVKAVHIKPRTIVVDDSSLITSISNPVAASSGPNVTVLPNPGSEFIETSKTLGSHEETVASDVVSRAVRESNLNIQKEADNKNEVADENQGSASLETLIVEGTSSDHLDPAVLTYYKNSEKLGGQVLEYYVNGQAYSSVATYEVEHSHGQSSTLGDQDQGQIFGDNVQVVGNHNGQVTFSFVDYSDKINEGTSDTKTDTAQNSEISQSVANVGSNILVNGTDVQNTVLGTENNVIEEISENTNVKYVIQEDATNTYDTENTDTADPESGMETDVADDTVKPGAGVSAEDNNNMHIIIENSNDSTVQRISIDALKKTLVSNNRVPYETRREEFQADLNQYKQKNNSQEDDSVMTTKELYLCGNCSAGFSSIQECKDHMLSDHGQYAEEQSGGGGLAPSDSLSSKVDAFTQVELKRKPGRKKKSEMRTSPVPVKEETISDSGSEEDWSEKLNVDYSRSKRVRRKRRPPAALKSDYYLGKKGKERSPTNPGMDENDVHHQVIRYSAYKEKLIYKCTMKGCTAKFKSKDIMKKHLDCHIPDTQESEPAFRCLNCSEKFFFWKQARYHMWKVHREDLGLLSCEVCDVFKTDAPSKMKAHMEVHSSDRPYICPVCSKGFKQLAQMKNHQVIHKDAVTNVEGKWYASQPCEICGRVFANSKCLKIHIDIVHGKQKPFKCTYCNHTCARKAMMELHIRTHTQEKPFRCDICSFATGDHNSLRRHKMRHSGQRPYKCPHCPYSCIQAVSLKVHIKNKHPGQEGVYVCHMCFYKTLNKSHFVGHLQDHKNGLIETLDTPAKIAEKAISRARRQKTIIKPQITNIYPKLLHQLQNPNQPPSQIITLQATNIDSANSQPQIIQLPNNPQVMQVEMQVQTNAQGENVISEVELAKLNNYEGLDLVQSDVAAAQLIFSALNAISQNANAQQTVETNSGAIVEEIDQTKTDMQTAVVENQDGVTHTITFHLPEGSELPREGTSEQEGVTLVEVTDGSDGIEIAQQIQSSILVAGQSAGEFG